jgi:C4-dicarboxylate-specific signal transduction histidine kinase
MSGLIFMATKGSTVQDSPIFAGLFYAALAAGLVGGFVIPIFIDFNGWLLTANLVLRALAPLAVLHAISRFSSPFSRRVWGYFFTAALFDGAASIIFSFAASKEDLSSGPIITPLGDLSQLACYVMITLALNAMRQTQQLRIDWRIPALNAATAVLGLTTIIWVVVVQGASSSVLSTPADTAKFLIELGYPLLDFVMLGSLVVVHTHRNPMVSPPFLWGITFFVVCLFIADGLIGAAIYLTDQGAPLLTTAGLLHGIAVAALAITAFRFSASNQKTAPIITPLTPPTWQFSTVMVGALFITMLLVAQLRFGASQDTLTVEVIAISCMAVAGLMILIRQTLVASHVQQVLQGEIHNQTKELQIAQKRLEASNRSLKSLVEHAPIAICARSSNGEILLLNEAWREMLGDCQNLSTWRPSGENKDGINKITLDANDGRKKEYLGIRADFINESGNYDGDWLIITDVTDIRAQETQMHALSRLASLGELSTNLAHELNQPLNAMRLTLANLDRLVTRNTVESANIKAKVERLNDIINRCASLISQMKTYGRAAPTDAVVFDVKNRLEVIQNLMGEQLRHDRITLMWNLPGEPVLCLGSPLEFDQVLINLMTNARDAILAGGDSGQITLSIASSSTEHEITIEDSGVGFPDDLIERLLEPFFTTKPVGEGTGLGLSITHGIIKDMGGHVRLENSVSGARVTLTIPKVWEAHDENK